MKRRIFFLFCIILGFLGSCSNLDESTQVSFVDPENIRDSLLRIHSENDIDISPEKITPNGKWLFVVKYLNFEQKILVTNLQNIDLSYSYDISALVGGFFTFLTWSPDGSHFLIGAQDIPPQKGYYDHLYLFSIENEQISLISQLEVPHQKISRILTWSPDSTKFAIFSNEHDGVYIVSLDGTIVKKI